MQGITLSRHNKLLITTQYTLQVCYQAPTKHSLIGMGSATKDYNASLTPLKKAYDVIHAHNLFLENSLYKLL